MINCHDSRGKGIVFFLLVICSGFSSSCNFDDDPISDDYMKKINKMVEYIPPNYQVDTPRIIPEEKEDQNCLHLLTLFLSNYILANIERYRGSELDKMIKDLQNEVYFLGECLFKIPSTCPNERINIFTVLQNLSVSLAALKPNIENNFTHCMRVKCATAVEYTSTIRSTIATRRQNKSQKNSTVQHTTPIVKFDESSSDHIGGNHEKQSNGMRRHYVLILPICGVCILMIAVIL